MDRFFDRLGDIFRSLLNDEDQPFGGSSRRSYGVRDPDLDAAYEELDDFLRPDRAGSRHSGSHRRQPQGRPSSTATIIPEIIRRDFAELGLPAGASAEDCKAAYKRLLKIHHPDRHAGHPGNMKKATEKSSRINASYHRIEQWRASKSID